jgi:hypothetical protein
MRNGHCLRLRQVGIIVLLGVSAASSSRAVCYSTPRRAADASITTSSFSQRVKNDGYQVKRIESDPVLSQKWAMVIRCGHPDWPVLAVPANGASSIAATSATEGVRTAPMVRAGDIVRLWRQESLLRIEVSGVAEESGGLGSSIRVRLATGDTNEQSVQERFLGVIRGPWSVEIQP